MATDLRERLQSTLGSAYTLERELGGGGMSRVFVADETAFGRKVVVKVLPPDRPDRARAYLAAFDERRRQVGRNDDERVRHRMVGNIPVAERRYDEAVREFRAGDMGSCMTCSYPTLARIYDLAGNADSAIAFYERYTSDPDDPVRMWDIDGLNLAPAHKRLGELYEAKGERAKAASHYATFVELWKDADPELQPHVREARERLRNLQRAERP